MKIRCAEGVIFRKDNFEVDGKKTFINVKFDRPGDVRDVPEAVGKYLAEQFPDKITIVDGDD